MVEQFLLADLLLHNLLRLVALHTSLLSLVAFGRHYFIFFERLFVFRHTADLEIVTELLESSDHSFKLCEYGTPELLLTRHVVHATFIPRCRFTLGINRPRLEHAAVFGHHLSINWSCSHGRIQLRLRKSGRCVVVVH